MTRPEETEKAQIKMDRLVNELLNEGLSLDELFGCFEEAAEKKEMEEARARERDLQAARKTMLSAVLDYLHCFGGTPAYKDIMEDDPDFFYKLEDNFKELEKEAKSKRCDILDILDIMDKRTRERKKEKESADDVISRFLQGLF